MSVGSGQCRKNVFYTVVGCFERGGGNTINYQQTLFGSFGFSVDDIFTVYT